LKIFITILLLFSIGITVLFANSFSQKMKKGNELYAKNNFTEALTVYKAIVLNDVTAYSLYYNLGCTYFQLDSLAQSIYYLEKAMQLNPKDEDVNHNLSLAYGNQQDDIDKFPELFMVSFLKKIANVISSNVWLILAALSLWFAAVYFYFKGKGKLLLNSKKLHFFTLIFGLFCFLMAYLNYHFNYNKQEAIVFSPSTIIYKSPNSEAENLIEIHEGLKVTVLDEVDQWYQIKMTDNTKGWLNKSAVKLL